MSAHTPGPWTQQVVRTDCGVVFKIGPLSEKRGKYSHACIYADYPIEPEFAKASANAHLIAAAPDLLAACKVAAQWLHDNCDENDESLSIVRAAIAKATP